MKVNLIKQQSILDYSKQNAQSVTPFTIWLGIIKNVNWEQPQDIVTTFNTADILGNSSERVVFNIGGNKYRLICKYLFGDKNVHLFIKWIGTHAQYTKLCNKGLQYSVNKY